MCQSKREATTLSFLIIIHSQPNNDLFTTCLYLKINNKLEIAKCIKGNWRSRNVLSKDHEVGLKCKHSESFTYGLKCNMAGDITVGTWYNTECNTTKVYN